MITLSNNKLFFIDTDMINEYKNPIPALIYGYVKSLSNGVMECTTETLEKDLCIASNVQNRWIKRLVKDKHLDIEYRGLHNKRYLFVI